VLSAWPMAVRPMSKTLFFLTCPCPSTSPMMSLTRGGRGGEGGERHDAGGIREEGDGGAGVVRVVACGGGGGLVLAVVAAHCVELARVGVGGLMC
jgi:hypothetical protein